MRLLLNMKYLSNLFKGRINRRNYVFGLLFAAIIIFALVFPIIYIPSSNFSALLIILLDILYFIFYILLSIKRFHDVGYSAKHIFALLIPIITPIWLILVRGDQKDNKYGIRPTEKINFPADLFRN